MEVKITDPELEKLYSNGHNKKLPTIKTELAKYFAIRVQQLEAAKDLIDLQNLQSIKLKKLPSKNTYKIGLEGLSYIIVEITKCKTDSTDTVSIMELFQ